MNRLQVLLSLSAAAGACACFSLAPPCPGAAPPAQTPRETISRLIQDLGSDDFETREAATHRLIQRPDAKEMVRLALKSPDAEVRRRARRVLDALDRRYASQRLAAAAVLAKEGRVDEAVERLVRWGRFDEDDEVWEVVTRLSARLLGLVRDRFGRLQSPPARGRLFLAGEFSELRGPVPFRREEGRTVDLERGGCFLVRAEEARFRQRVDRSLIVCAGPVECEGQTIASVVLAGGDVEVRDLRGSLVVCDGEFRASGSVSDSLVIARGPVRCPVRISGSVIIGGDKVHLPDAGSRGGNVFVENEDNPLGFVRFFDPSRVGLEIRPIAGGVRVRKAQRGKPFYESGLRVGDVVLSLDGSAVPSLASFRRLLRRRMAEGGEAVFRIRRVGETVEIRVPCAVPTKATSP